MGKMMETLEELALGAVAGGTARMRQRLVGRPKNRTLTWRDVLPGNRQEFVQELAAFANATSATPRQLITAGRLEDALIAVGTKPVR